MDDFLRVAALYFTIYLWGAVAAFGSCDWSRNSGLATDGSGHLPGFREHLKNTFWQLMFCVATWPKILFEERRNKHFIMSFGLRSAVFAVVVFVTWQKT